jgi:hypothetical protein
LLLFQKYLYWMHQNMSILGWEVENSFLKSPFSVFVYMNTGEWIETKSFMVQDPKIWTNRKEGLVRPVTQSFCSVIHIIFNRPDTGRDDYNDCFHCHCIIVRKIKGNWFPVSDINYWILLKKVMNVKLWI